MRKSFKKSTSDLINQIGTALIEKDVMKKIVNFIKFEAHNSRKVVINVIKLKVNKMYMRILNYLKSIFWILR